jgi:hypothetical protein
LNEATLEVFRELSVRIDINKTDHAVNRQSRHGASNFITDEKITDTVKSAGDKILQALLFNRVDIGDKIVLQNRNTHINLVCQLVPKGKNIEVVVITVMKKENFASSEYTIQVWK